MNQRPCVLVIEDQIGDILWLLDLIRSRGYEVMLASNEDAARKLLKEFQEERCSCALVIVDVAVAVKDLRDLVTLDEQFFEESQNTGIRLCRYIRQELGLLPAKLPMACLTVRDDDTVRREMNALQVPLFNKATQSSSESIRGFIEERLPRLSSPDADGDSDQVHHSGLKGT